MNGYEFYIGNMRFAVNFGGVFVAAWIAAILTFMIVCFLQIRRFAKDTSIMVSGVVQMKNVMERCRRMFPIEVVEYRGITFRRGMAVKITLSNRKSFIGCFVGSNYDDMVCVITPGSIIAQQLELIEDLAPAEEDPTGD